MKLVKKNIEELIPADYNPRTISDSALDGLRASFERFGYVEPIIWNKKTGRVIGGHQRLKILLENGEKTVEVREMDLNEVEEKALNVTLNNPHNQGEWDYQKLDIVLSEIKMADFPEFKPLNLDKLDLAVDDKSLEDYKVKEKTFKKMFQVVIDCEDETEQETMYNRLTEQGIKCKILTL